MDLGNCINNKIGNLFIVLILLGIFILGYAFRDKIS